MVFIIEDISWVLLKREAKYDLNTFNPSVYDMSITLE